MKQFLKFTFASVTAMLIVISIVILVFIGVIGGIISSSKESSNKDKPLKDNSVLHITLKDPILDKASDDPFQNIDFDTFKSRKQLGLNQLTNKIKAAKEDEKIKGIYLDLSTIPTGIANVEEIRTALRSFKASDKWIISYSEVYTQKSYYLASVADKVYLNPAGIMELRGLLSEHMFFKNALEKLDVDVQIIRHGKFKSAVEPFMLEEMSASNREQQEKILNTLWGSILTDISTDRGMTISEINNLADEIKIRTPEDAVKHGLIDQLVYKDELIDELRKKLEIEEDEKINYVSIEKYKTPSIEKKSENQLAVIYASGNIVSGKGEKEQMGSETISKAIRDARLDSNIKAIVLRVNSPGGSALASDVMWREVVLAKKEKPVIVSMGNVAASGGYYIACAADKIVASEKTITGSIGVFGMIPNAQGLFNNKLGITFDRVKTNTHSDMVSIFKPLSSEEKDIIQLSVEDIYDDFISKVAEGRNMTKEAVDSIGQGRVWAGLDAKKIGLVDEIGGLKEAIEIAKEMTEIEDLETITYPKKKQSPFEDFMTQLTDELETKFMKNKLGESYKYYKKINALTTQSGIMARMPYDLDFH